MLGKREPQQEDDFSRTGIMRRSVLEPEQSLEPKRPNTLPEEPDEAATTGTVPIVSEGQDKRAERDTDKPVDS